MQVRLGFALLATLLLLTPLTAAFGIHTISWEQLNSPALRVEKALLSDSDLENGLRIVSQQPEVVAGEANKFALERQDNSFSQKTSKWEVFQGLRSLATFEGAVLSYTFPDAGRYRIRATTQSGERAEFHATALPPNQDDIQVWHNGDLLPLGREGVVIFAAKKTSGVRAFQWSIPGREGFTTGQAISAKMLSNEDTLAVTCTVVPMQDGAPSRSFAVTVKRTNDYPARVRKNIYDMTDGELAAWGAALDTMKLFGVYDHLIQAHLAVSGDRNMDRMATDAHRSPSFMVWHRLFIDVFERSLIASGLPAELGAPYWEWENDADVDGQCMWSRDLVGNRNGAVTTSPFRKWRAYGDYHRARGQERIRRCENWESRDVKPRLAATVNDWKTLLATKPDFETARKAAENCHNLAHVFVGGNQGDMATFASPNDPLFWMVHSRTEKMHMEWQAAVGPTKAKQYYGENARGTRAGPNDLLTPWGITVSGWLDPVPGVSYGTTCTTRLCQLCNVAPRTPTPRRF